LQAAAQWGGNLSYGTYLFHNALPVLVLKIWPHTQWGSLVLLSLAGTLLLAFVVHQVIEAPARAYGRALGERMRNA
jgi:peptidoglycan/LPS O-acetylase OafA/YrhL